MGEHFESVHDIGGSCAPVTSGLQNNEGQHSCFLNAAIQALWHTDSFREAIGIANHVGPMHSMIQSLFANIEHGGRQLSGAVIADVLRAHLADLFAHAQRFQMGCMDDAGEALEAILATLHQEHVGGDSGGEEETCNPPCVAHAVFGFTIVDQTTCMACCANSDPEISTSLVSRAYATDILAAARGHITPLIPRKNSKKGIVRYLKKQLSSTNAVASSDIDTIVDANDIPPEATLSGILRSTVKSMPKRTCPSHDFFAENGSSRSIRKRQLCQGSAKVQRYRIGSKPRVLAIQIVWPSDSATKEEVKAVLNSLDKNICLEKLFMGSDETGISDTRPHDVNRKATYRRLGVINFYGQHYTSAFSMRPRCGEYILCDDATIKAIGQWDDAKKRLIEARWMPTMVLYEDTTMDTPVIEPLPIERTISPSPSPHPSVLIENELFSDSPNTSWLNSKLSIPSTTPQQPQYQYQEQSPASPPYEIKAKFKRPRHVEGRWGRRYYVVIRVEPGQTGLGLRLRKFENGSRGLEVIGFEKEANGSVMPAKQSKRIQIGDRVLSFNDRPVGDISPMEFNKLVEDFLRPCSAGYGVTLELRLQERLFAT